MIVCGLSILLSLQSFNFANIKRKQSRLKTMAPFCLPLHNGEIAVAVRAHISSFCGLFQKLTRPLSTCPCSCKDLYPVFTLLTHCNLSAAFTRELQLAAGLGLSALKKSTKLTSIIVLPLLPYAMLLCKKLANCKFDIFLSLCINMYIVLL